jgi:predicted dehydrogenase
MASKLKIGIVGCGGIANHHVKGYLATGEAEIAMVYDVAKASAERMAGQTGASVAGSLEALAGAGLDAVSVCTPPGVHLSNCRPLLDAGVAVLCEKPLAASLADAEALAAAATASRAPFMVAYCHRFHGPIVELKRLIDAGTLGEPVLFRNLFGGFLSLAGNHRVTPELSGGGVLVDNGSHSVDLFRHLVGEPTTVQAFAGNAVQDLAVEDIAMLHLAAGGRRFAEIASSYSLKVCGNWVEWYGTKGTAIVSYGNAGQPDLSYRLEGQKDWTPVDCTAHRPRFEAEVRHFLACVRDGSQPAVTAQDGVRAARVIDAAYASARDGRAVRLAGAGAARESAAAVG